MDLTIPPLDLAEESYEEEEDQEEAEEEDEPIKFTSQNYRYRDDPANYNDYGLIVKPMSCDTVRMKINTFLATKEMTQKAFMETIGVSSGPYHRFMGYKGKDRGSDNSTYFNALVFFAEREKREKLRKQEEKAAIKLQEKEAKAAAKKAEKEQKQSANTGKRKKRSSQEITGAEFDDANEHLTVTIGPSATAAASTTTVPKAKSQRTCKAEEADQLVQDLSNIQIHESGVFDDCDDIRTKLVTLIKDSSGGNNLMTMTKFAEVIGVTPSAINKFLAKKGFNEGAGSIVYENSYYFFEKYRIFKQEAKSPKRKRNEKKHPNGFALQDPPKPSKYVWIFGGHL